MQRQSQTAVELPTYCAWCGAYKDALGWTETCIPNPADVGPVSHGICPACRKAQDVLIERMDAFTPKEGG